MTASRTANTIPFLPFISLSFRSLGSALLHFRSTTEKMPKVPYDIGKKPAMPVTDTPFYENRPSSPQTEGLLS
jgi:hypothetical protein